MFFMLINAILLIIFTTFRREAEKVLRLIARSIPAKHRADTRRIMLPAADAFSK